jgi:tricarballylate dehydrogenase
MTRDADPSRRDPAPTQRVTDRAYDVLVIGGGAAALCAAIAARRCGATVAMVDQAPAWLRGGNTRHARNLRISHDAPAWYARDVYREAEFLDDLHRVAGGGVDAELAARLVRGSSEIAPWLALNGVRFQRPGSGVQPPSRRTAFFAGGGKTATDALYGTAQAIGVVIAHDAEACGLCLDGGRIVAVDVDRGDVVQRIAARAVVACAGGHQANLAMLREGYGAAADSIVVRGAPYASGRVLRLLIDAGADAVGDLAQAHLVAVDARGPKIDGGIVTRLKCIPYGIVVDQAGRRFCDEGSDIERTHYAKWGERLIKAPGQVAFAILDAAGLRRAAPTALPPVGADSIEGLAEALQLDPAALTRTVLDFNAATGSADPGETRAWRTEGLDPPKSAEATPIAAPPFAGFPLRPGITFTHFGVAVDPMLRIAMRDGSVVVNLLAAGMIMSANVLPRGYLAGLAVTLCAVFGRLAGEEAARYASG